VAAELVAAAVPAVLAELVVVEAVLLHRPAGLVVPAVVPPSSRAEPVAVARQPVRAPVAVARQQVRAPVAAAQLRRLAPAALDALVWAAAMVADAPACAAIGAAAVQMSMCGLAEETAAMGVAAAAGR
jgi:hypothetical protein